MALLRSLGGTLSSASLLLLLCSLLWVQICIGQPAYTSQGTHVFRSLDASPDGKEKCLGLLTLGGGNAIADIDCPSGVPVYIYNIPDILWDFQKLAAGPTPNSYQFQSPAFDSSNYQGMRLALCAQTGSCGGCPDRSRLSFGSSGASAWVNCTSGSSYAYYPGQGLPGVAQDLCWNLIVVTVAPTGSIVKIQPCNGAATDCLAFSGVLDNIPSNENSVIKPWHQRALLRPCSSTQGWQLMNINSANTLVPYLASQLTSGTTALAPAVPPPFTQAPLLPATSIPIASPTSTPLVNSSSGMRGIMTARVLAFAQSAATTFALSAATNITSLPLYTTDDFSFFVANNTGPLTTQNSTIMFDYLDQARSLARASNSAANSTAPIIKQSIQINANSTLVTLQSPVLQHFLTVLWIYLNGTTSSPVPDWYAKVAYFLPASINMS